MLKIRWTTKALKELDQTLDYIEGEWGELVAAKLNEEVKLILNKIASQPNIGKPIYKREGYRKMNVMKYSSLFYHTKDNVIEILAFFSNRQHPSKQKL